LHFATSAVAAIAMSLLAFDWSVGQQPTSQQDSITAYTSQGHPVLSPQAEQIEHRAFS
jgi:hypothetical protein